MGIKELQAQIDQLTNVVRQLGGGHLLQDEQESGPPPGFIEHGSPEHATFLGLIEVSPDDIERVVEQDKTIVYKSHATGTYYRLQDEIGLLRHYPGIDPEKAALIVLRQKVGVLESGKPEAPKNAPSLWRPNRLMA